MNRATPSDGWVRNHDNKTLGYTANIITGCLNQCPFPCFARVQANGRLRDRYLANNNYAIPNDKESEYLRDIMEEHGIPPDYDPFYPRLWPERIDQLLAHKTPCGIFLNIMGEWAGDWVPLVWQVEMFDMIRQCPRHRFYLLTKQYQNLWKFSPFPENCWVGASVTNNKQYAKAVNELWGIEATIKFLSIEPLLSIVLPTPLILGNLNAGIDWIIAGSLTGTKGAILEAHQTYPALTPMPLSPQSPNGRWCLQPKVEWVAEICEAADKASIPIFLKDNLRGILPEQDPLFNSAPHILRQEMPKS